MRWDAMQKVAVRLTQDERNSQALQFAGLVLAAIPAILVYAIFQNYIIKGIGEGSTR